MPVIVRCPRAQEDIVEIWSYIADDSEAQADAFVDRLDAKFQLLARQSGLGRLREELAYGVRSFPVGGMWFSTNRFRMGLPLCVSCIAHATLRRNSVMIRRIDSDKNDWSEQ